MPFPLAHPAAVLPLRRYCPRRLNFAALVVGSIVPDAGYCFSRFGMDALAHRFIGGFTFCLPAGLIMLFFIYGFRNFFLRLVPERCRKLLLPSCWQPPGTIAVIVISLLLGVWTHQLWDAFTHTYGWVVMHLPVLQTPLVRYHYQSLRVCHLLWYGSSFAGVSILGWAYQRRLHATNPATPPLSPVTHWRNALTVGVLLMPIEVVHHLVHGLVGIALVGICSLALVIGMAFKIGHDEYHPVNEKSARPISLDNPQS